MGAFGALGVPDTLGTPAVTGVEAGVWTVLTRII